MTLDILENDVVLRRRCYLMLDFLIDNRVIRIISPWYDVFIKSRRAQGNEEGCHENRHGQADEILAARTHDDHFTVTGKLAKGHERTEQYRHGEGYDNNGRQRQNEDTEGIPHRRAILIDQVGYPVQRARTDEDCRKSTDAKQKRTNKFF